MPPLKVIVIRWAIMAACVYVLSFLFGKRIRMRGIIPAFTVALVIAPANAFLKEIADVMNVPDKVHYLFAFAVVLNAVILYGASFLIPDFDIENFAVAVGLALLLAVVALVMSRYLSKPLIELTSQRDPFGQAEGAILQACAAMLIFRREKES